MSGKNLKVDLIANTSQFKAAMSNVKKEQQLLRATFRNSEAATDSYGKKLDSTSAKIKRYSGEVKIQQSAIKAINSELKKHKSELEKGNITKDQFIKKEQQLKTRLQNTEASLKSYQAQLKRISAENNKVAQTNKRLNSDLEKNRQNVALIVAEYKKASSETDKYGNKIKNLAAETKKYNSLIDVQKGRMQSLVGALKTVDSEYKKGNISKKQYAENEKRIRTEMANTQATMNSYAGSLKKIQAQQKATASTSTILAQKMNAAGLATRTAGLGAGIVAGIGLRQLKRALGSVITETLEFEKGMAEVKAVSGATTGEMAKLEKQAKDLGKSTVFTSQNAANAMAALARAGFTTTETLSSMPGLLDLAASSNMDLGVATEITADLLRGFNMQASDASRVADVLAKGASMVNTDVEGMGKALSIVAPIAKTLGFEIEGTSSAIAVMSNNGIKGEKSGRMLRQGLLRLSKPTGEAEKLIKKLGIEVFDTEGNMKDMDQVVGELETGMKGMTKQQKAAALATIFGSESTAGWTTLLEAGQGTLADYTVQLENSEGAAKKMAKTMTETADGAITRMQSALSGMKIELGQQLTPVLSNVADLIGDFAESMSNLDKNTMKTISQIAIMTGVTLAIVSVFGLAAAGIGALMMVTTPLTVGLIALGAAAVGLDVALALTKESSLDLVKTNVDLLSSSVDTRKSLENTVKTFDDLSEKANISNSELAKMNELNEKINRSSNPIVIEKLQKEYDELARASGLSKEELQKLFEANKSIIEQSPDVEKSVSDQGDAFVEHTDKVKENIKFLRERDKQELEEKRRDLLQEEGKALDDLSFKTNYLSEQEEKIGHLKFNQNLSIDKANEKKKETLNLLNNSKLSDEDRIRLAGELENYRAIEKGTVEDLLENQTEVVKESRKDVELAQDKLAEIDQINMVLGDILLAEMGINEQGEQGLATLDKEIEKNKEKIENLNKQKETKAGLTKEEEESLALLTTRNDELINGKEILFEEFGISKDANSLFEHKLELASEEKQNKIETLAKTAEINIEEGNILKQLDNKNDKHVEEIKKLETKREKEGENKEEIDKQIKSLEDKKGKNDEIIEKILKELGLWDEIGAGIEETKKKEEAKKKKIEESNLKLHEQLSKEGEINKKKDDSKAKEDAKGKATNNTKKGLDAQGNAIDSNNKKTDTGVKKEQDRTKEASKNVNKDVNVSDKGKTAVINKEANKKAEKNVDVKGIIAARFITAEANKKANKNTNVTGLSAAQKISAEASRPVSKTVSIFQNIRKAIGFAKGTPAGGYKGNRIEGFLAGEEGVEIGHYQGKMELLPFGAYSRPHGYNVIPHEESMKILSAQSNAGISQNSRGSFNTNDIAKNLAGASHALRENKEAIQLTQIVDNSGIENSLNNFKEELNQLSQTMINIVKMQTEQMINISNREIILEMDKKVVGKAVSESVKKESDLITAKNLKMLGM